MNKKKTYSMVLSTYAFLMLVIYILMFSLGGNDLVGKYRVDYYSKLVDYRYAKYKVKTETADYTDIFLIDLYQRRIVFDFIFSSVLVLAVSRVLVYIGDSRG